MHASPEKFRFRPQNSFVLILANRISVVAKRSYSQIARNLVHVVASCFRRNTNLLEEIAFSCDHRQTGF